MKKGIKVRFGFVLALGIQIGFGRPTAATGWRDLEGFFYPDA